MHILFCDLCNESVPESDLGEGRAYYLKGRLICPECDSAMGGGGRAGAHGPETPVAGVDIPDVLPEGGLETQEKPALQASQASQAHGGSGARGGSGAGGVLVGLLALAFSAVGFNMVLDGIEQVRAEADTARGELEGQLEEARAQHRLHTASVPGLLEAKASEVRASEQAARDLLRSSLETLRTDLATAEERERQGAEALERLRGDLGQQDTAARGREAGLKETIATLEKDVRFFSDRIIELEETLRVVSARGPVAAGGAVPATGAPMAAEDKPWMSLLAGRDSTNAGIRLDTIYALGETGDPAVVPYLVPMLGDVDLFVRMATARMLEDLDAAQAVPALIDALEDNQSAVREAAMVALRKITSKSFGFEPVAGATERAKRIKTWRDWWKKEGGAFLSR